MLTASIGSCLAKRVATNIAGGRLISSVFHNRSDVLADVLHTNGAPLSKRSDLCALMGVEERAWDEFSAYSILSNQSKEGFGLHDLASGVPLIEALTSASLDLIIIDNFMDLVGRLYETPLGKLYYRYEGFTSPAGMALGPRLLPAESAKNFRQVVELIGAFQPKAKLVFVQFPINNYPHADRRQWGWDFRDSLDLPKHVLNIPVRRVQPKFPDREPHHFASREYRKYANQVSEFLATELTPA